MAKPNKSVHPIALQQIQTVYYSGLNNGIGSLRGKYSHGNMRERLLVCAEVGMCPGLSNRCNFLLAN